MNDIENFLKRFITEINDERRVEVYNEIKDGSKPSRDFFIMLSIATVIATLGLLTNSVAVIIGAMLVSPLLMAVLAISLGAMKGDILLFWDGMQGMAKGAGLSLLIAIIITLLVPNQNITAEILARIRPTPLDLLVALASGLAGAYAICRKNISAVLPGIAIAVAVLPPLSVVGIGVATRRLDVAVGGGLMFAANVIAIDFAASFIFWLMGFGPRLSLISEKEMMNRLKTSIVLLLLILIPLAWVMYESINKANTEATIEQVLHAQIDGIEYARITDFNYEWQNNGLKISATLESPKDISQDKANEIKIALEKNLRTSVNINLKVNQVKLLKVENSKAD
ncbi:MAG: TIGR00341 family protein [Candidatus Micrarchaeota archaeon]